MNLIILNIAHCEGERKRSEEMCSGYTANTEDFLYLIELMYLI